MFHREDRNDVAIIRMEHGKVNAMDSEMFEELHRCLDDVKQSQARALILTGTGNTFSAGVDLFRILNDGRPYIEKFLPILSSAFEQVFQFPKPVVALVNGHAIAGGCILACACDYRIASDGSAKIGIPELPVGVPFPAMALEIVRYVSAAHFQEIVYGGRYYSFEEGLALGLVDEIMQPERAMERALTIAERLGSYPSASFQITKDQMRRPAVEQARARSYIYDDVLNAWCDPKVHEVIRAYLDRTIKKA